MIFRGSRRAAFPVASWNAAAIAERGGPRKPEAKFVIKESPCYVGINKGEPALQAWLNEFIAAKKALYGDSLDLLVKDYPTQVAPLRISANALLAIDQNRATVVDRIVANWGDALVQSGAGLTPYQLREVLNGLRADHLLAIRRDDDIGLGRQRGLVQVAARIVGQRVVRGQAQRALNVGAGFVGFGMLDAACPGQVFTSPTPDQLQIGRAHV